MESPIASIIDIRTYLNDIIFTNCGVVGFYPNIAISATSIDINRCADSIDAITTIEIVIPITNKTIMTNSWFCWDWWMNDYTRFFREYTTGAHEPLNRVEITRIAGEISAKLIP